MKNFSHKIVSLTALLTFLGFPMIAWAAEETANEEMPLGQAVADTQRAYAKSVTLPVFKLNGVELKQNRALPIHDAFKDPGSRKCKPFCVQPNSLEGATTITLEDFPKLAPEINTGKILLVDMRTTDWYAKETLPGAINIPYSDLTGADAKAKARMNKLQGKDIIAFCNGWWCGQSPTGIKALQSLGFTGKIYYFRGGNQDWADAGLPSVVP